MNTRRSGILLHPTSLPSPYGIGDFGPEAYEFVDFLHRAGQKIWQVLPLTIPDETGSPYASPSAFAGNWLLISPDILLAQGLIDDAGMPRPRKVGHVNYDSIVIERRKLLERSLIYFKNHAPKDFLQEFRKFQTTESAWLKDFALFMAIKEHFHGRPWRRWPSGLAERNPRSVRIWSKKLAALVEIRAYSQWLFFRQWQALKSYANHKGIEIIGDLPFFVRYDSVDVWTHRRLFLLDRRGLPQYVSGVPPDYFSARGQVWNDPHYDWKAMERTGFSWWLDRFHMALRLYDRVRLDHFRGYAGVWHIRRGSLTARKGHWSAVPGGKLFSAVRKFTRHMPFVAEDLGYITEDVIQLRKRFGFPGTRVMQFGFSRDPGNVHRYENYPPNAVVYTGTHDNAPARGWIEEGEVPSHARRALQKLRATRATFAWKLIARGMDSASHTFIMPMQDVLGLGAEARMNTPSTKRKNWRWRLQSVALTEQYVKRLRAITRASRR